MLPFIDTADFDSRKKELERLKKQARVESPRKKNGSSAHCVIEKSEAASKIGPFESLRIGYFPKAQKRSHFGLHFGAGQRIAQSRRGAFLQQQAENSKFCTLERANVGQHNCRSSEELAILEQALGSQLGVSGSSSE